MKHNIKIGIFRIGFDESSYPSQHRFGVWVTMEGKSFRAAKRRIRKLKEERENNGTKRLKQMEGK